MEYAYALGPKKCWEGSPKQITHSDEQVSQPKMARAFVLLIKERVAIYSRGVNNNAFTIKSQKGKLVCTTLKRTHTTVITKGAGLV